MSKRDTLVCLRAARPLISAGVLSADMMHLDRQIASVRDAGIQLLHFDLMDGQFCPMLTFGPPMVKAVRTDLLKDVHLMVRDPLERLPEVVRAGADLVVVNVETTVHIHRALQMLGDMENANDPERGLLRGVALNPGTPLGVLEPLMDDLEVIFLLAVNPGWGGQGFIPSVRGKLSRLVGLVRDAGREILVGIDGGIVQENVAEVAALGPDLIVAGSAVFRGDDPGAHARRLSEAARAAAGVNP
ncbi:MAG TPA: ribulose-phosphate 3-epimerase [Phycisphaerae bacterium]|nr:ribulose-phosphate 3-epimerase [Phycisphaerae bacterium]